MQTSLIIESIDPNNKKNQQTMTYVNAKASSVHLDALARKITALTQNSYVGATRVDKTSLGNKPVPNLTLSETSCECSEVVNRCTGTKAPYCYEVTVNYDGDGELSVQIADRTFGSFIARVFKKDDVYKLRFAFVETDPSGATITVTASETETYAATSAVFTVIAA